MASNCAGYGVLLSYLNYADFLNCSCSHYQSTSQLYCCSADGLTGPARGFASLGPFPGPEFDASFHSKHISDNCESVYT